MMAHLCFVSGLLSLTIAAFDPNTHRVSAALLWAPSATICLIRAFHIWGLLPGLGK